MRSCDELQNGRYVPCSCSSCVSVSSADEAVWKLWRHRGLIYWRSLRLKVFFRSSPVLVFYSRSSHRRGKWFYTYLLKVIKPKIMTKKRFHKESHRGALCIDSENYSYETLMTPNIKLQRTHHFPLVDNDIHYRPHIRRTWLQPLRNWGHFDFSQNARAQNKKESMWRWLTMTQWSHSVARCTDAGVRSWEGTFSAQGSE